MDDEDNRLLILLNKAILLKFFNFSKTQTILLFLPQILIYFFFVSNAFKIDRSQNLLTFRRKVDSGKFFPGKTRKNAKNL